MPLYVDINCSSLFPSLPSMKMLVVVKLVAKLVVNVYVTIVEVFSMFIVPWNAYNGQLICTNFLHFVNGIR